MFIKVFQKNTTGEIKNVICNSAKQGLIPQREYFDKDIANSDNTSGYYIIKNNDFVYNPRKSSDAPYGPVSRYKYSENGIVSPLYLCFRARTELLSEYFDFYFKSPAWHRYIYMCGDSGARHDRVSIKDDVFFAMPVNLPSKNEQEKIAKLLLKIEEKIQRQQLLVETLKKYKRGVVKNIFANMLEWKKSTIKEHAQISTGISNTQDSDDNGDYPFFVRSATIARSKKFIYDGEAILTIGDGQIGKVFHYYNGKFDCHQRVYMLTNMTDINTRYLFHFFSQFFYKRAIKMSAKNTVDSVRMEMIADMPIYLPSLAKQQNIASLLDLLDKDILLKKENLNELLLLKKGLIQHLFI